MFSQVGKKTPINQPEESHFEKEKYETDRGAVTNDGAAANGSGAAADGATASDDAADASATDGGATASASGMLREEISGCGLRRPRRGRERTLEISSDIYTLK